MSDPGFPSRIVELSTGPSCIRTRWLSSRDRFRVEDGVWPAGAESRKRTVTYGPLRPWGILPRRSFAEKQLLAVTAYMITLWDLEPADGGAWKHPGSKAGATVLAPTEKVRVRIQRRRGGSGRENYPWKLPCTAPNELPPTTLSLASCCCPSSIIWNPSQCNHTRMSASSSFLARYSVSNLSIHSRKVATSLTISFP